MVTQPPPLVARIAKAWHERGGEGGKSERVTYVQNGLDGKKRLVGWCILLARLSQEVKSGACFILRLRFRETPFLHITRFVKKYVCLK